MPGHSEPTDPDTQPSQPDPEPSGPDPEPTNSTASPAPTGRETAPTSRETAPASREAAPASRDAAPGTRDTTLPNHGARPSKYDTGSISHDTGSSDYDTGPSDHGAALGDGDDGAAPGDDDAAAPGDDGRAAPRDQAAEPRRRDPSLERLVLFSDAVFAIAITLLALDLRLPEASPALSGTELLAAVLATWPHVASYTITFVIIGAIWISHLRLLQAIVGCDTILLGLNLLLLGTVGLLPFHTALLGGHFGDRAAALFYSLGLVLVRLAAAGVWWYAAAGRRLLDPALSSAAIRSLSQRVLLGLGLSLLGALAALLDPTVPKVFWLLAGAVPLIRRRTHRPRRARSTTRP